MLTRLALPAASILLAASATAQTPTMDELWPNDDGRSWTYAQHYENFEQPQVIDSDTRIFFDGTTVAPGDIQAQYLRQQPIGTAATATAFTSALRDPFLRHLWTARPDLRDKILRAAMDAPCPGTGPQGALGVLRQGELAYRKTADEIAAWRCNRADTRSWLWLVSDLTLGNTFTLQLIPDVVNDVFLHGTIAAIEPVTVAGGTFAGCVRVDYVIDYGTSECADIGGHITGVYRSETRGYIDYAPGVGPVKSHEDFILYAELNGDCGSVIHVGDPAWEVSLQLSSLPTPVRRSTWGRLKAAFR